MSTIKLFIKRNITKKRRCCIIGVMLIALIMGQTACKKFVEIPGPTTSISEKNAFSTDETAIAVLSGLYIDMGRPTMYPIQGSNSIALFTGLSSDELTLYSGVTHDSYTGYYRNALSATIPPTVGSEFWSPLYNLVFRCNAAIEGLSTASKLTLIVQQQLLGEAKFLRAFCYFYLVNLFGDVPLALSTDPQENTLLARTPKMDVYRQIVADLKHAKELLSNDYLNSTLLNTTTERVRPTKWAATALLARVYLYTHEFEKAEVEAGAVINHTLYNLPPLNNVFLKNSGEAIWQLQPTTTGLNTAEGVTYIIPSTGPTGSATNPVYASSFLLNSFEPGDQRAVYGNWLDTTIYEVAAGQLDTMIYPYKYKINEYNEDINPSTRTAYMTEYLMILRLGEQYLIRAEARAHLNNIVGAKADLDAIRTRAGLLPTGANDEIALLEAVLHERQAELFSEWGHRWLDLKRTGKVDGVMSFITPIKSNGASWQSFQQWYPLPVNDLNAAPNLVQNLGY